MLNGEPLVGLEKRLQELKDDLKPLGLKPLRNTPKDVVFAVECLHCGGFWQQKNPAFHFPECNNTMKGKHAKEVIFSILGKHGF